MSLDDLMIISDNRIHMSSAHDVDLGETTFTELAANIKLPLNDPKLEKKVTFARLMNKVSAEMSSGSEVDAEIVICQQLLQILTKMRIFYFFFFWFSFNHFTLIFLCLWCPGISFEQTNKKNAIGYHSTCHLFLYDLCVPLIPCLCRQSQISAILQIHSVRWLLCINVLQFTGYTYVRFIKFTSTHRSNTPT